MKKILIIGLFTLCFISVTTTFTYGRGTDASLVGHVVDQTTGEHLPFVTVYLRGTTIARATDASGHFMFTNMPVGEYVVVAQFIGFERSEQTVVIEPNRVTEVNFYLVPQALELSGIVVTGSRGEVDRRESTTVVNVLNSRLFEMVGATCVSTALNFQPGLRVESTCHNSGSAELRINGLSGQYSQILLNGRAVFSPLANLYGLEMLPVGMIDRVEVIRGGGSALFGSNAVAGVVNIITREPVRNSFTLSNMTGLFRDGDNSVGTDINTSMNASIVTDDFRSGAHIFAVANNRNAYDRDGDGFVEAPTVRSEMFGFRGYHNFSSRARLTAEYHRMNEFRRGGDYIDRPPHLASLAEQLSHNINGGGLTYTLFSRDYNHRWEVFASARSVLRESYFGEDGEDAYGRTADFSFVGGSQYSFSMDNLLFMPARFTAGFEYKDNTLRDQPLADDADYRFDQEVGSFGLFLQNEWRNERLSLVVGGRLDHHRIITNARDEAPYRQDARYTIFSPRASARFAVNNNITLRASYASGHRAPMVLDEDLHEGLAGGYRVWIQNSPDLEPERSNSLSFSVDMNRRFRNFETNFLIDAFHTRINNVFAVEPLENGENGDENGNGVLILERVNEDAAIVQGINFDLTFGFAGRFFANIGYTLQRSRFTDIYEWGGEEDIAFDQRADRRTMFRAPNHYGYFVLNYVPFSNFTISATGTFTGPMYVPRLPSNTPEYLVHRTESFFNAGLRLAYEFRLTNQMRMRVTAGVTNVFDQFQTSFYSGQSRDCGFIYGPAMPRMWNVGVRFSI